MLFKKIGARISSHFDRQLYLADSAKILADIRTMDASIDQLLVVGHNPGIADLALALGDIKNYAPGTLATFKADCKIWSELSPANVTLDKVFVPEA